MNHVPPLSHFQPHSTGTLGCLKHIVAPSPTCPSGSAGVPRRPEIGRPGACRMPLGAACKPEGCSCRSAVPREMLDRRKVSLSESGWGFVPLPPGSEPLTPVLCFLQRHKLGGV